MPNIFLISDTHFNEFDGPNSVVRLFHRPFKNSMEMNRKIIENWNSVVKSGDIVFSLGDFAHLSEDMVKYASQLNGKIVFVLGNHDFEGDRKWMGRTDFHDAWFPLTGILTYKNKDFLLAHSPDDIPYWWQGWVIHGHHHIRPQFPFIDGKKRNINVASDLIDFTPVSLDWIYSLNLDGIKRMERKSSVPTRWESD